ncbi:MAG: 2,3-bisphosphoglycerate-independent phosphoglycerate mutase [Candidatus Blackburnbacteria bacterium]|nr:2,3-bisphosphoglycerate-independent phosphoglycerate mutase [Candidatus Blackburnbacteria bacterium]
MNIPLVVLIIMDGWGIAPPGSGNAISLSNTSNFNKFWAAFPHTTLAASGEAVGLPKGEAGNTETGHLNLGAGRIVYQDLARINMSIADGSFFRIPAFLGAIEHAKKNSSNMHLMGLVGTGGVHSNIEHLFALLRICKDQEFNRVYVHLFTDGRDSPPTASMNYVSQVEAATQREGVGRIATMMGRYWAMDRDFRWERTEKAYRALTSGVGQFVNTPQEAIEKSYNANITDEFINPTIIVSQGKPVGLIQPNDAVVFFNFRIDRPRQLTRAFVLPDFESQAVEKVYTDPYAEKYYKKHIVETPHTTPFLRGPKVENLYFVTMTEYDKSLSEYAVSAFPPSVIKLPLSGLISSRNMRQLKLAESEKERFVTYYFNGQQELSFPGEYRKIIPSPHVPTYDMAPEMSARSVTHTLLDALANNNAGEYSLVVVNFANADMVGHTGNIEAARVACSTVDECVGQIVRKVNMLGGATVITADHGNAEEMKNSEGKMETEHSRNPVPLIVTGNSFLGNSENLPTGILADVAPTILKLLGLPQPTEMSGRSLL